MFDLYRAEDLINQQEILITLIQNKMKDEYIIINKTAIEKRIEELKKENEFYEEDSIRNFAKITQLKQILFQSTPLIPEIEKAWVDGNTPKLGEFAHLIDDEIRKQDYISNLKLDIWKKPCTWLIVQEAMRIVSKDVRPPKCVRDGLVKPNKT